MSVACSMDIRGEECIQNFWSNYMNGRGVVVAQLVWRQAGKPGLESWHTQPLIQWVPGAITMGVNQPRCKVDYLLVLRSRMVELYPNSFIGCKGVDWIHLPQGRVQW
jgi:hypothetical protein